LNEREAGPHHARRFPPPWSVEELDACLIVKDRDGQKLAYVYFEDERRIAVNIAKLAELLRGAKARRVAAKELRPSAPTLDRYFLRR
jgi:hypothetical protein